ncbi:MAG: hypothetical protein EOM67_02140 [Spirochaetia bacterium]|nr:hypothetical protein [Spirochaetia bacterium]
MNIHLDNVDKTLPFLENGVSQIAYVVEDLEATVEKYHTLFGIGDWHFYTYGSPLLSTMKRYGKNCEYKMRVALSYFGPMRIELIQHLEGDTVYTDFIKKHGFGIQHLGFLVKDMTLALLQAKEAGLVVTMEGGGHGPDGDGYFAYLDTEDILGTTIELIERPKRRQPPEKIYPAQ